MWIVNNKLSVRVYTTWYTARCLCHSIDICMYVSTPSIKNYYEIRLLYKCADIRTYEQASYGIQWNLTIEDAIGIQLAVLYTVEPLYRGHHWDPAGCPIYSGTSLQRTPLGPSWLSCIQWNLSIEGTIGTQLAVLYTVEPLYRGHHWDPAGCPVYRGVLMRRILLG